MSPSSDDRDGTPIRVLVVDADRRVRRSLAGLIDLAEGIECVAAAADGPAALAALDTDGADICLLDPGLPELETGISLIAALRERRPGIRIVAMNVSDACEGDCLDGGADAFVAKSDEPEELVDILRAVARRRPEDAHTRGL